MEKNNLIVICVSIIIITSIMCVTAYFLTIPNTNTNTVSIVNNTTNTEDSTNSNDNSYLNNPLYADFNEEDLNGDGGISFEEELSNIAHTPRDAAYEMFTQADSNGDGLLKGQEYINCREALQNSPYTASHINE